MEILKKLQIFVQHTVPIALSERPMFYESSGDLISMHVRCVQISRGSTVPR